MNSQMISLSNSLTPCDPFEIIFQTFLTDMRLPYLQAIFHKGGDHLAHRKLHVMQLQAVVVLYGKMPFPKMPLQDSGGLSRIGYEKMHMPAAFSLQLRKRLLLQQHSMVDDPNVIRQKGDLRKDVAGDQDGLSPFIAEAADKGTDLRDADRIQPVDGLIQDQQLRVMHDREGNEKKLLPRIGSLIESPGFYPNLTGTENLRIFAALRGVPNRGAIKNALDLVGLPYKDKKLFSQYSLGMKQRLAIALAVMHDPELLDRKSVV